MGGTIGSMADQLTALTARANGVVKLGNDVAALTSTPAASGAPVVEQLQQTAKQVDELLVRAEAELDQVRKGAALVAPEAGVAVPDDALRGVALIGEDASMEQRQALVRAILARAHDDVGIDAGVAVETHARPGVPLDSARQLGQPLVAIRTIEKGMFGKVKSTEDVPLLHNFPVGDAKGYAGEDVEAAARAYLGETDKGGVVIARAIEGSDPVRYGLHWNAAGSQLGEQSSFVRGVDESVWVYRKDLDTVLPPKVELTQSPPASLDELKAIASTGPATSGDPASDLTRALADAGTAVDDMRGAREALRTQRSQAAKLVSAIDTRPGTGDPYSWELDPLFGPGTPSIAALERAATAPAADPNHLFSALRGAEDGSYVVLAGGDGALHAFPYETSKLAGKPAHADVRAFARVHEGQLTRVDAFRDGEATKLFGGRLAPLEFDALPLAQSTGTINSIPGLANGTTIDEQEQLVTAWLKQQDGPSGAAVVGWDKVEERPFAARFHWPDNDAANQYPNTAYTWRTSILDPFEAAHDLADTRLVYKKADVVSTWNP